MGDPCDHHHHEGPPDAAEVERALAAADARLSAEGERMTAARLRVLGLLLAAGEPVKAYDLIARFGEDGRPAKPPTVYRALEFLERKGLAHRIASISAYVACNVETGEAGSLHAAAFLICDCCGATEEVSAPAAGGLDSAAEHAGYVIARTTIEAHGRCPACRVAV
ncbi:Fur family transcriptional regulator [Brevundimonas sp.]|uniref:Fur family transcriptional regulator n=1 Tax=Brevundimonas sp. TaxID=1871086 RepID=UPI0035690785